MVIHGEHNILYGMGSTVAEDKAVKKDTPREVFIGLQDSFGKTGSQRYVWMWTQAGLIDE